MLNGVFLEVLLPDDSHIEMLQPVLNDGMLLHLQLGDMIGLFGKVAFFIADLHFKALMDSYHLIRVLT